MLDRCLFNVLPTNNIFNFFKFILVNPTVGGDVVSCGSCGEEFSLSSLSLFIQHKSLPCSPANRQNPRKFAENPRTSPDSAGSADTDSRVESSSQSSRKTAADASTNTVNTGTHLFKQSF